MFHTTEGVVGYDSQAILLKRTFDTCIALHPFHGFRDLAENNIQLFHLLWIRLTIQRPDGVAIPYGSLFLEFTCYERIEVDRNRIFAIAEHGLPAFGYVECGGESCPDVRLVKAREGRRCLIRQEYRIHEFFLTVECLVGAGEVDLHDVQTLFQQFCSQHDMLVLIGCLTLFLIVHRAGAREATLEVEYDIILLFEVESDHSFARHRCLGICRNVECQIIGYVTDVSFTLFGEFLGNAFFRHLSVNAQYHHTERRNEKKSVIFHLFGCFNWFLCANLIKIILIPPKFSLFFETLM